MVATNTVTTPLRASQWPSVLRADDVLEKQPVNWLPSQSWSACVPLWQLCFVNLLLWRKKYLVWALLVLSQFSAQRYLETQRKTAKSFEMFYCYSWRGNVPSLLDQVICALNLKKNWYSTLGLLKTVDKTVVDAVHLTLSLITIRNCMRK